ncbi:MAG TPA: methyl-accepting chemotaxis protein [Deltaproteobacteria bacterium]|nr:methyl-accepting chemotaxis protein [Deltaproteobacteria bacterium]HQI80473.1 methyl-accepting chemotaxis protein [Deltaproteobacteria bacterium]
MKESTKVLFLRPLLFQELVTAAVIVPMLLLFFLNVSEGIKEHFLSAALGGLNAANVGLVLGILVKYFLVKPALVLMEKDTCTPDEVQRAVRSISILPLAESITVFLRFALFGNLIAVLHMVVKGYIQPIEGVMGVNTLVMSGLLAMPFFYLASENSLVPFYQRFNLKEVIDGRVQVFRMSLNQKLLGTILLIAIPPIGLILGAIYLSVATGFQLAAMKYGFVVLLGQTALMTFINGFLITKSLSLSVGKMSFMLEDMARGQGDLTKRLHVTGLNEVGTLAYWFNEFMENIEQIVRHVMEISLQLHQSIQDVSAGSQDLSQATQEQAASVEEISASIEEMNGTIQHNADLIREGQESSNVITKLIDQNKQVFADLMKAIEGISLDSRKIGDIVVTVNEVAFHTNLLALNASVEAARAGEHGKGFAVVAGEVRSLAQRSAAAASEIKALIEGTVGRIKTGDEMMKKTSSSLEELMSRMEFFFRMMEVISTSSTEQSQNIGELSKAIGQIDGTTQHNASTVEELASTLDNLRAAATVLAEDVQKFKVA